MQPSEKGPIGSSISKLAVIGFLIIFFILVTLFPFSHQTQTLWYKIGTDRTLLIAGQLVGLYSVCLVWCQLVLIARPPFLTKIFGVASLSSTHRFIGKMIPVAVMAHVLLILVPEGLANLPVGWKFWPEMLGFLAFLLLLLLAVSNWLRLKLAIPYPQWKTTHRLLGLTACLGVGAHIVFVSDAFRQTAPRIYILILFISVLLTYSYGKWKQRK
ncbi:ferric reductase-like transmembrane domain-containing protein [Desulfopila sp. IMCC35008]|uniref:ferric reductase-like transmembrane domain-containing protein n=1 Tax=Desulfopila sp. IMCC35008 TaxID=2653858 RepID=UPI0013D2A82E|nr:ferric reductase-like transmembrane domain-containing protein [Desulfopila sp. IMCC35008]